MKHKKIILILVASGLIAVFGYGLYRLGLSQGINQGRQIAAPMSGSAGAAEVAGQRDGSSDKKVLFWHDPMVPGQKFDKPGKSPFMDMQLVPVYADDGGDEGNVSISPRVQQNLGIRVAEVTKGKLASVITAVGSVAYNERAVALLQARSNGFVEKLYVRAPLDPVRKGQPLAELYVPEWVAAQEEYLAVKRMQGSGLDGLAAGARQRMRLVGMTDDQVRLVEATGKLQRRFTIAAPIGGVVGELSVREGMTVMAGAPLFRINGLDPIWVNADIPENVAAQVRPGNMVEARTPSLPGTVLKGKVSAILPEINTLTRTLKARIELRNNENQLVPGMFVTLSFTPGAGKDVLLVPSEAVIQTGTRSVVMVASGEGKFRAVEVEAGLESNGQTEITKGLEAGQKVVVSGQFLIDSEASLKGTATRMSDIPATPAAPAASQDSKAMTGVHHGEGKVEQIDKDDITLSHGPIPSLQWGPMTMGFKLPATGLPKNVAVGDTVRFDIRPMKDGMYQIVTISPAAEGTNPGAMQDKSNTGKNTSINTNPPGVAK